MDLIIFNIATGVLLIISSVGLTLFIHWDFKKTGDSLGYCVSGFMVAILFFFLGCYKSFCSTFNIAFPKIYNIYHACIFLFLGILSFVTALFSKKITTNDYYGIVGGYIFGGSMLLISIICLIFCLIK